jgi:PAS domain S-box-containing protein
VVYVVVDITEGKKAEEALRQSEVRYRTVLEQMEEAYYEVDLAGNFTFFNDATCRQLGYSREELMGMNYQVYTSKDDVQRVYETFNQVSRTGKPNTGFPVGRIRKDGARIFTENSAFPLRNESGKIIGFRGVVYDITERKRADDELRQSEERYRTLFNSKLDGMCVMDETMKVLLVNQAAVDIFGFDSIDEALGANPFDFIPVEERERVLDIVKKDMFEDDLRQANEFRLTNKSGKDIWVSAIGTLTENQGKLAGLISFRDITEHKLVEEALVNEATRRRILIEQSRDGIVVLDEDGKVYEVNQRFADMLGYSPEEVRELRVWDWEFQYPREQVQEMICSVDEKGDHFETRHRRKDGTTYDVEISTNAAMFAGHKLIFCVCRDITSRKQAEEELRQSEERYRTVLEKMEEGYFEADLNGNFTVINDATCHVLGYPREEIIGINYRAFVAEEYVDALYQAYNQVYQTGKPIRQFSWEVLSGDGRRKFIEASISPLRDKGGQIVGLRGVGRDITERKKAEEALRLSEQNFRDSIESSPLGIHIVDKDGKHIYANRAFLNIWGYNSIEEMQAVPRKQRYTPKGYAEHMKIIRKRKQGEDAPLNYEVSIVRSDGQVRQLAVSYGELLWNGERQFQVVYQDITERKQAEEKVKKLYSLQTAIRYINEALLKVDDERALFEQVCHFLTDVEFIKFCWIGLADKESREVKPVAYSGFEDGYLSSLKISLSGSSYSRGPIGTAIKTSQPCTVADIENDPVFPPWREAALKRGYASSLAVPLIHDTEVIGVLSVYSGSKGAFGDAEIDFLVEAAADVALGIRTLRLRRELQQSLASLGRALEGTVSALASVAEVRDPYTAGHQQRVTRLAVAIATEMGLPQEQIEGIHVAGSLHDVGKLYIPAEILSKPGKLNEVEFNLVKMHSQAGYDILKTVEFPWPVAQIVLQHHERLDGSGYPQGLKNEDILLEAKILAVADVVEAMASHRPYRPSLGMGQALDEISHKSGILYDPKVVDACFKLFYEKEFKLD